MVKDARRRLLYISPVIPALTGNGLAMRAGTVLEVLRRRYEIDLLVARLYAPFAAAIPEAIERLCRRAAIVALKPARLWGDTRYDVVHVFRLAMVPFSQPYWGGLWRRPRRHLDLDDIESITRRRLAGLYRQNGQDVKADREESEAARQEQRETEALRRFDRVYVCSAVDRAKLESRARADIRVLPNGVRLPAGVPAPTSGGVFQFLFAGTLGYYPNEDAVRWLASEIVPRLREMAGDGFRVTIVGTGASQSLREAAAVPQVRLVGEVPDMAAFYAEAHAVVVPLRAGGGTRIKVLEAFSYRRPVVATGIGMEGIEALPEEHVLIGDTADAIARQCGRLMADGALAGRLAGNAHDLLLRHYTLDALAGALGAIEGQ